MPFKKLARRTKQPKLLPSKRKIMGLYRRLPPSFRSGTLGHVRLINRVSNAIAKQLSVRGVEVDLQLVDRMSLAHDVFRDKPDHARLAQEYFSRKGYPLMARGIGRHVATVKKALPFLTIEEKILLYVDSICKGEPKKGKEGRVKWTHRVYPLEDAIRLRDQRLARETREIPVVRQDSQTGKALQRQREEFETISKIEQELIHLGLNLKQILNMKN